MTTSHPASADKPEEYVVRLSGAQGMVAAIPQCLGFFPDSSLVLMCLQSPRGRVGPVVRVDIPPPGQSESLLTMLDCAERYADEVAVVCFHEGLLPGCIGELTDALRARRIPIIATLSVTDHRIRDARSKSGWRRDSGIPLLDPDDTQALALRSAAVLAGRLALPSRAALAASITPTGDAATSARCEAIDAEANELAAELGAAGRHLTPELVAKVDDALHAGEAEYREFGRPSIHTASCLIALSAHLPCRDLIMARALARNDMAMVGLLVAVAAQCPDGSCVDLCAVLAGAAYRFGDGALAQCALDRAMGTDPHHRLSTLLRSFVDGALPPSDLDVLSDIRIPDRVGVSPETA